MQLKTFRHLWGITDDFTTAFPAIKKAGYDGVEHVTANVANSGEFNRLLKENDFELIAQVLTVGNTVEEHFASFKTLIEEAILFNPILINSHSGRDGWTSGEKQRFFSLALDYERSLQIPVAHETHRGRTTYNPWDTRDLLLAFPELKLCCDFSHWVCVCESLLQTELDIICLAAERCLHLHARVGYEQGPQVPDPRAPEYAAHLQAHEDWWDIIWQAQQMAGHQMATLTPEFGPPPYHHTLPFTAEPVSDLWEICNWMAVRQKSRFAAFTSTTADTKNQAATSTPLYEHNQ